MLEGRVALITGAGKGIGKEIAMELSRLGAKCVINYASSSAGAEETVNEIKKSGGDAYAYKCDVSDYAQVEKMISDAIEQDRKSTRLNSSHA